MPILELIAGKLGCKVEEVTEEKLSQFDFLKSEEVVLLKKGLVLEDNELHKASLSKIESLQSDLIFWKGKEDALNAKVSELETETIGLNSRISELEPKAQMGEGVLSKRIEYAKEMYSKSVDGKIDSLLVSEIESETSLERLESKINLFGGKALNSFGARCKKCHSNDVEFRSSTEEGNEGNNNNVESLGFADKVLLHKSK